MIKKFAVIGLGNFGKSIARQLSQKGAEVIAIDKNLKNVEELSEEVAYAVQLDSTDIRALKAQNIEEVDGVVLAIGSDFEAQMLTAVILKELNVKRIIARASGNNQKKILEKLEVEEILSPEHEVGKFVADTLINPDIVSTLSLPDNYEIAEVTAPVKIVGKKLGDLNLRNNYNINVITVMRTYEKMEGEKLEKQKHIIGVPNPDTEFFEEDVLVLLGKKEHIAGFIEKNQ